MTMTELLAPPGWLSSKKTSSRWARFRFCPQHDATVTIEEDTENAIELNWENVGTNVSGRILSYAFDPTTNKTIWVGSAGGGLFKTDNAGESWKPMTDHLPSMAISDVIVKPDDPKTPIISAIRFAGARSETYVIEAPKAPARHTVYRTRRT